MEKIITTSGPGLLIAKVNKKANFFIHNVANSQLIKIRIEGPNNTKCEAIRSVTDTEDVIVEYFPRQTGEYIIHILYNDVAIPNSPFTSKIYDINQIKVKEMPKTIQLHKPATFLVEASNAGPGMLEVIVNQGQVSSKPKALGPALYAITFTPKELIDHDIQIIFNGEMINGSPFSLKTVGTNFLRVQKPMIDRVPINSPVVFQVKCPINIKLNEEMFSIYSPGQKRIRPEIKLIGESRMIEDGSKQNEMFDNEETYEIKFVPEEVGDHIVDLKYEDHSVPDCAFLMKCYDSKKVKISDLSNGVLGKTVYFTIDASNAGAGNLEIIVSVNNGINLRNVPNYVESEDNVRSKFRVNFKPKEAVPHQVKVKFNGESVQGSPYTIQITDNQNEINLASIVSNLSSLRMCSLSKGIRVELNKCAIHQTLGKLSLHMQQNVTATGYPSVELQAPSNQRHKLELVDKKTEYEGIYQPKEVGPYQVYIKIDGCEINSALPINCNVYDVSKVKVSGLELAILGKPITFQVDASSAGEGTLELVVTTRKCSVKADVLMRSRGLYDVTFLPNQQTQYYVNVTFNEEDVPGTPFKVDIQPLSSELKKLSQLAITDDLQTDVVDRAHQPTSSQHQSELMKPKANKLSSPMNSFDLNQIVKGEASTENATCLVGSMNIVYIELDNHLLKQLQQFQKQQQHTIEACVFDPRGNLINSNLTYDLLGNKNSNKLKLDYTPNMIGTYKIELINAITQQSLLKNAITVECCDPSRVRLLNVTDGIVGKQQQFTVDCSKSGCGSLQLSITCKQQQVPFELFELGPNSTQIKISSLNSSNNGNSTKINSKSGIFIVKYKPEIDLPHYIDVLYNGHQAAGCPQLIEIRDATELLSILRDSIFKSIQINQDVEMLIEETSATSQGLIVIDEFTCKVFDCDNQPVKNYLIELSDLNGANKKQFKLQFKPIKIGTHRIEILYLNNHLTTSPLLTECFDINKVKLLPIQNTNFIVNEKIFLSLDRKDAGYAELDVVVTSPLGRHLPIELTANDQKELICFIPTVQGKYKIAISYGQLTVPGTPITFIANQATNQSAIENCLSSKQQTEETKPQNQQLANGHQQMIQHQHLNQQVNPQQIKKEHQSNGIRQEDTQPIVMLKQTSGVINERFMFTIDSNGYKGLPLINIDGPEQEEDLLVEEKNRIFYVSFVPVQVGVYEVKISWNGKEIAKPFKVNIVNLNAIKPKQGWKSLFINQEAQSIALSLNQQFKVTFLTNDAGQGNLIGEIVMPNGKIQANVIEQATSNKYKLSFIPKLNGKYLIRLFYSNLLLPQQLVATTSPQFLLNSNASLDNQINSQILNGMQKDNLQQQAPGQQRTNSEVCVTLKGQGLAGALVGQIGHFVVDGTSAVVQGIPQVTLKYIGEYTLKLSDHDFKDKNDDDLRPVLNVTEMQSKIYKVSYKAKIPGYYVLNILWGNKQVSGCPLKLHITPNCDASLVEATGSGLKECVANKKISIKIDTSKAGPGQLVASCTGPKKIAVCSLVDETNGMFTLNFTPQESGKHILTIKYGNENIPNSPFTVKVHAQNNNEPDPSKVRVYGPGIEHGVLPLYQSRFVCETKGAGAGQLTVRIRGPKGAFRVEMARDNTKERSILCKYDPTEPGHYRIEVKWSGEHVPNSPFDVIIFDTQFELNRFLQNGTLGDRNLPPTNSALSNNIPMSATGTLQHHQTAFLTAPQPISFHKTLPSPLSHHLPIHPLHTVGHYSLTNHMPQFPGAPIASLNTHLNPQFLPMNGNEFAYNPYGAIPWRELH